MFPANISHNSATIHWTVPAIAYDTETYSLLCGTELNILELRGASLTSGNDIEDTSINLFLTLIGLQEQTLYYCRVQSTNNNGTTVSNGITSFTTRSQGGFTLHSPWWTYYPVRLRTRGRVITLSVRPWICLSVCEFVWVHKNEHFE